MPPWQATVPLKVLFLQILCQEVLSIFAGNNITPPPQKKTICDAYDGGEITFEPHSAVNVVMFVLIWGTSDRIRADMRKPWWLKVQEEWICLAYSCH